MIVFLFLIFSVGSLFANPFQIEFPEKQELSEEDYLEVQKKLRSIDIEALITALYPEKVPFSFWGQKAPIKNKQDFRGRISRGANQTFLIPHENKKPKKTLHKMNQGGDCCIVSYSSYDGIYSSLLEALPAALEKTGFNGYFLSLIGAFPNPSGKEIKWSGVPYCFKIFALLEAEKLGFSKVLWIDSALLPLKDPQPLFTWIEKEGCFFQFIKNGRRYLLPKTRDLLLAKTGVDMYETKSLRARVIGLDLRTEKAKAFLKDYYALVELGIPFTGCFPEEFALGALLAKTPDLWPPHPFPHLVMNERKLRDKSRSWAQDNGFFFLLQNH